MFSNEKSRLKSSSVNNYDSNSHLDEELNEALQKYRPLSRMQKAIFCFCQFVGYINRKSLYPYAAYFAQNYHLSNFAFSFILSGFDIGGILAIFASQSSKLRHVKLHHCLIFFCFLLSLFNFFESIDFENDMIEYYMLLILRIGSGLTSCIIWCQISGAIAVYCKEGQERTKTMMLSELSWTLSTLFFLVIGTVIYRWGVNSFWYLISAICFGGCFVSYLAPNLSIYQASLATAHIRPVMTSTADLQTNSNLRLVGYLKLFTHYPHLWLIYSQLIILTFVFTMIYATFGTWIAQEFDMNSEQLGIQLIVFSIGEVIALLLSTYLGKYISNVNQSILGCIASIISLILWILYIEIYLPSLGNENLTNLNTSDKPIVLLLIILFFYEFGVEWTFLNVIVASLNASPHGYQNVSSLAFSFIARVSSSLSTILGPFLMQKYSFIMLLYTCLVSLVLVIVFLWSIRFVKRKDVLSDV